MYRLINRNESTETRRANNNYEVQYQRRTTMVSKRRRETTNHGVIKKSNGRTQQDRLGPQDPFLLALQREKERN